MTDPLHPHAPKRVQLSRRKGYRKPDGAVMVARPSKWGNPYRGPDAAEHFAAELRACMEDFYARPFDLQIRTIAETVHRLRGRDLACWCPLTSPCHADVLLEVANG